MNAHTALRMKVEDDPDRSITTLTPKDAYLNYAFADQLRGPVKEIVSERMKGGVRHIVMDLSNVDVMDSCGLSVLIGLKKLAEESQATFSVCGLAPMVRRLFKLTKLERVFDMHDDAEAAREAVSASA